MTLGDSTGVTVYLSGSGRWVRTDVRRYPKGVCPGCGYVGALRRNLEVTADAPDGWLTRKHSIVGTALRCSSSGVVVRPEVVPGGWDE